MENFTPLEGLVGGLMIGGAAAVLAVLNGRIAGIAGIYRGLIAFGAGWAERATFVAGLLLGPIIVGGFGGIVPIVEISTNWFVLILAGLLVGFGASLGNGCTSGHGVCGIGRLFESIHPRPAHRGGLGGGRGKCGGVPRRGKSGARGGVRQARRRAAVRRG